ncbi:MAG: hypothetical protein KF745_08345 [Phycisphaeraceae bacterium]|nr:hypothetical protein [Phycisphaeraceae bacterium]
MAVRSGGGTGMIVAVVILSVLTLGLFITTIVFLSQKQSAEQKYATYSDEVKEFVREDERRRDDIGAIRAAAKAKNKSAIGYMSDSMQDLGQAVAGSRRVAADALLEQIRKVEGAESSNLLAVLRERDAKVTALASQLKDAVEARQRAQKDLENEAKRTLAIETAKNETVAALTAEVDKYKDEIEKYREDINVTKDRMDQEIDKTREAARAREAELIGQARESQEKAAIAGETVKRLQEQLRGKVFKPGEEFALVDGQIVGADAGLGQYFINRGRKDNVVLGMTFEVYSDANQIRPDPQTGDYPAGKATLEVIKIDDTTSTLRMIRERRGNPVVKGDVIANAIYDPNKVYKFHIYGLFDANRDGLATQQEQADIEALIKEWGGEIATDLTGDVDFLVLGQKPTLPPAPPSTAPPAVVQNYVNLRNYVQQYDRLWEQANATSIPILNENRLRTLTGIGVRN